MHPKDPTLPGRSACPSRLCNPLWPLGAGLVAAFLLIAPPAVAAAAAGAADPAAQAPLDTAPRGVTEAAEVTAALPAQELARIRAALERMVVLMEQEAEVSRAGLALRRLDMETGRTERLEGRLAAVRDSRASLEDQQRELEERYRLFLRQEEADGDGLSEEERLAAREQLDSRLDILEARSAELGREASELANRLAESRRSVREWESVVGRMLQE